MKLRKEIITHFSFMVAFLSLITVYKGLFDIYYLSFWLGGILGTMLPDVDHLIYIYILKPSDLSSQRIASYINKRDTKNAVRVLYESRLERTSLIFHTAHFQLIFLILAFLVITSSGSVFGRGLVLSFSLHLLIDQFVDFMETGRIDNWFKQISVDLDANQKKWYLGFNLAILLVFGFFL